MFLLTLLLILTVFLNPSQAAASLKLHKHKTSGSAYLSHLSRRGITPDANQLQQARKRDLEPLRRHEGQELVVLCHPELSGSRSQGTNTHAMAMKRQSLPASGSRAPPWRKGDLRSTNGVPTPFDHTSSNSSQQTESGKTREAASRSEIWQAGPSPSQLPSTRSGAFRWAAAAQSDSDSSGSADNGQLASLPTRSSPSLSSAASSNAVTPEGASSASAPSSSGVMLIASASDSGAPAAPTDLSIDLESMFGIAYTVDALIGDDQTPVPVLVDTGSATFWVAARECNLCASSRMTTSLIMGDTCPSGREENKLYYGKGEVFGCAKNASIGIGGLNLTEFPVVGVVNLDEDTASLGDVYSGMWGIASSSLNSLGKTPVDQWYEQGAIQSPEVGFYLVRDEDPGESEVIIGDALKIDELDIPIDTERHVTLPRMDNSSGHYSVKLDSMKVGGKDVEGFWGRKVIVDTGTTMLIIPRSLQLPIFGSLNNGTTIQDPKTKAYVLPCDLMQPTDVALTLVLGGVDFGVQFRDISGDELVDHPGFCTGALMSLDDELILLGGTFLVNVRDHRPTKRWPQLKHQVYHSVNTQTGEVTMYGLK